MGLFILNNKEYFFPFVVITYNIMKSIFLLATVVWILRMEKNEGKRILFNDNNNCDFDYI